MKKFLRLLAVLVFTVTLIITQTSCGGVEKIEKSSYYMDTICTITIYDMEDMNEEKANAAIDSAFSLCADMEATISATIETSEVYQINEAGGAPVKCSDAVIELLQMGIDYGDLSDGRFDITLGKVTDLWDFHGENPAVPDADKVKEALSAVDYQQIHIDGNKVSMENPDGKINLGGIGKGFIADRAAGHLESLGVTSAIVNFGGNIVAIGENAGDPFKIGIKDPNSESGEILGAVTVEDATVVTSGVYERCFEQDGKTYHHILDVETGYPVDSDVISVTLVAPKGYSGVCDALSTTCLIYGVEDGLELIEGADNVEAIFVDRDGKIYKTSGMDYFEER
ncbi:MAG: FAD:protein FMN transferase [Firmicutes bacterium]|nr:FAD:protein FMN transferase [Bacillota bacterium]